MQSVLTLCEALRVAQIGVVAGLRSQLPFALLAFETRRRGFAPRSSPPLSLLRSPRVQAGLALSAAGELIGDKLPMTPSRLAPGPLAGRLAFGAAAGAAVAREAGQPVPPAAALGAAGAALGSVAGYHYRAAAGRATPVPDLVWAVLEDALALALGLFALRRRRAR